MRMDNDQDNISLSADISTFESLPDELILDILEYLSVVDLYKIFYPLNERFRIVLNSLTHLHGEAIFSDDLLNDSFKFFSNRIRTLTLNHSEIFKIPSALNSVRSLRLNREPNRGQCEIFCGFSALESLVVVNHSMGQVYYSISLPHFVFNNFYPRLSNCQMNLIPYRQCPNWSKVFSLRRLIVRFENLCVWTQILDACPSLITLKIELRRIYGQPNHRFDDVSHESLRHLEIHFKETMSCSFHILDLILSTVPNVTHLVVRDSQTMSIFTLSSLLKTRLNKLVRFYFEMVMIESVELENLNEYYRSIKELHSCFNSIRVLSSSRSSPPRLIIQS